MPPQITVEELATRLKSSDEFILLDIREPWELDRARLRDARLVVLPMSRLAREGLSGLPAAAQSPDTEMYVLCHHGQRSDQVTAWLASHGWKKVFNVAGGIEEYAMKIDRSVGRY